MMMMQKEKISMEDEERGGENQINWKELGASGNEG